MTYGLSLQRFARSLDLSFQQVQKYETGTNRVAASTLVRIAEVLGVPVAALLEGVDAGDRTSSTVEGPDHRVATAILGDLLALPDPAVRRTLRLHLRALARASAPTGSLQERKTSAD